MELARIWAPWVLAIVIGFSVLGCADHRRPVDPKVQSIQMSSPYYLVPSEDDRIQIHVLLDINSSFFKHHFDDDRLIGNQQIRLSVAITNGAGFTTCLHQVDLTDGLNDITIHSPAQGRLTLEVDAWGGPYDGASTLAHIDLGNDPTKKAYDFSF